MLDRNKFLLQVKMPNMQRCHGYWRRIRNYWKNMSNGMPARRHWNRWLQLFITLIWYLIIFNQWAEKRSERLAKPAKVTRGKSNLSSWKVPSKISWQSWQCYHKYSSGRDKHEVLEEMTSHLGDSSTKATDKGQVGGNWTTHDLITAKSGDVRAHHLHCCCDRCWCRQSLPCRGGRTTFCVSSWFRIRVGQGQFRNAW